MLEQWLDQPHLALVATVAVGAVLLLFGRRLYWLALGAAGFVLGLWIAERFFAFQDLEMRLGLAFLLGIVGAVLTITAQHLAILISGFLIGGLGTLWVIHALVEKPDVSMWFFVVAGAIVGFFLAKKVFEAALVILSCVVGAGLITQVLPLEPAYRTIAFVVLVAIGVMIQSRGKKARLRHYARDDEA